MGQSTKCVNSVVKTTDRIDALVMLVNTLSRESDLRLLSPVSTRRSHQTFLRYGGNQLSAFREKICMHHRSRPMCDRCSLVEEHPLAHWDWPVYPKRMVQTRHLH